MIKAEYYAPAQAWTGRIDGDTEEVQRWHQRVKPVNLQKLSQDNIMPYTLPRLNGRRGIAFLGFACDEGVRRNKGRVGAAAGPAALRKACSNFPVHFDNDLVLIDAGDIICPDQQLEAAQDALTNAVKLLKGAGYLPLLLGGGHEITYGHARQYYLTCKDPGLINIDAHFDLRMSTDGPTSGTGFWQLAQDCKRQNLPFRYLALGIQTNSNTPQLFRIAGELDVEYIDADAFHLNDRTLLQAALNRFIQSVDSIYLTIDLDVFAAAYAPGVSAVAYNGIRPDGLFLDCYRTILQSGKLAGLDIAELNPTYDIDNHTAKLAAALLFEAVT
jgi:formiminoglutamase